MCRKFCKVRASRGCSSFVQEAWLNYYDIFVRHAFGNLRDVIREVTYNPIMGNYLTYKGNRALDACLAESSCLVNDLRLANLITSGCKVENDCRTFF